MKKSTPTPAERGLVVLVGLAIVVWGAALLRPGRAPVWGTASLQFIPWRAAAWRAWVETHTWLWWNPDLGHGAPLIANLQMAWFYPPTWLLWALAALGGVQALAWGHGLLIVLHLLWAAAGMFLLARSLNLAAPGPAVAALAYALSGYLATRAEVFLSMNAATAWTPWVLWAGLRLLRAPGPRPAALLALTVSLQILAGHAQTAWYTLVLLAVWLLFWGTGSANGRPRAPWRAWLPWLLAAAGLTALLTAAQVVPTGEYLRLSARATGVERDFALTYSLWPWRLLGLIAPNAFGSPVTGDYWGYAAYYEDALYIGLLSFLLALSTLVWAWRGRGGPAAWAARLARWGWAVTLAALVLALGRNTPVFPWLYAHVPTFAMFQAPTRWSLLAVFALALLAGVAAASWPAAGPRARYWLNLSLAGAAALMVLAAAGALVLTGRGHTIARALAWAGLWALGAAALARWAPRPDAPRRRVWAGLVVAWVALDLVVTHWGWTPTVPASLYAAPGPADLPAGRVFFPFADEYAFKFEDFFRMTDLRPARPWEDLRAIGLPNLRLLDGAATWNNFDPLLPARYARLREALEDAPPGAREALLDRLAVLAEIVRDPTAAHGRRVLPREPEPYAQWFPQAQVVPDAAAAWEDLWLRALQGGPEWQQTITVVAVPLDTATRPVPAGPSAARPAAWVTARGATLAVARLAADRVQVWVTAPADGWLLLAEQAYPGWRAAVDGEPVPVYIAEYALMAVPVPAGVHTVTWVYRPAWWPGVGWASLLGLVGVAALIVRDRPGRGRAPGP